MWRSRRLDLLELELFRPRDHRPPDQLIHQDNRGDHEPQAPQDRARVACVSSGLQVGSQTGQPKVAIAEHEHLARDQEEPAACHGHHRIPNEAYGGVGHLQLHESLPPAPAIELGHFLHFTRDVFQRRVEAEGHVPRLPRKNQQDGA